MNNIELQTNETVYAATANVKTDKAVRYLKALCNHFSRKVEASYEDNHGVAHFPFGECTMEASSKALLIQVSTPSEELFERVKYVVADHLVRFSGEDELVVDWVDAAEG